MALQCFYPVLMAEDVEASARFYAERMGFEKTFESDRYVSLRHRENRIVLPLRDEAFGQRHFIGVGPGRYARRDRGDTPFPRVR